MSFAERLTSDCSDSYMRLRTPTRPTSVVLAESEYISLSDDTRARARSNTLRQAPLAQRNEIPNSNPEVPRSSSGKRWNPLRSLFGFLRDGTQSLSDGTSSFLGNKQSTSVLHRTRPTGGLLSDRTPETTHLQDEIQLGPSLPETTNPTTSPSVREPGHTFPSWSTWKDWKKLSLDLYFRIVDSPQQSRVRVKQTIALLPVVKLKPVIDFAYRGPGLPPVAMHLDVKLLDCIKYRVRPDGTSTIQVRTKSPLSDPRFAMDVLYERDNVTKVETVKIAFRALNVAFLKAPGFMFGMKFPIRFNNGIKAVVRIKKHVHPVSQRSSWRNKGHGQPGNMPSSSIFRRNPETERKSKSSKQDYGQWKLPMRVDGPMGLDVKLRCLEYR